MCVRLAFGLGPDKLVRVALEKRVVGRQFLKKDLELVLEPHRVHHQSHGGHSDPRIRSVRNRIIGSALEQELAAGERLEEMVHGFVSATLSVMSAKDIAAPEEKLRDHRLVDRKGHDTRLRRTDERLHHRSEVEIGEIALKLSLHFAIGKVLQDRDEPMREDDRHLRREARVVGHQVVEQRAIDDQKLGALGHPNICAPFGARKQRHFAKALPAPEIGEGRAFCRIDDLDHARFYDE